MRPPVDFLGVPLVPWTVDEFTLWLVDAAFNSPREKPTFVTYLNAWCTHLAAKDPAYAAILRDADAVYADGKAIVWASAFLGRPVPERVNAGDFITDSLREAASRGTSVYLLGSSPGVADGAAAVYRQAVPGLNIAGTGSGYWDDNGAAAIRAVSGSGANLLILGLGVPAQEKWAWENRAALNVRAIWCVGALFEYYSGQRARAPVWVRRAGLEWLFRLILEPRRLAYRYTVGNASFLWRVLSAKLRGSRAAD